VFAVSEYANFFANNAMTPINAKNPELQTAFEIVVWGMLVVCFLLTFGISSIVLYWDSVFEALVEHRNVLLGVLVFWILFTLFARYHTWAVGWSLRNQLILLGISVATQSIMLGLFLAVAYHQVILFAYVVVFGLTILKFLLVCIPLTWMQCSLFCCCKRTKKPKKNKTAQNRHRKAASASKGSLTELESLNQNSSHLHADPSLNRDPPTPTRKKQFTVMWYTPVMSAWINIFFLGIALLIFVSLAILEFYNVSFEEKAENIVGNSGWTFYGMDHDPNWFRVPSPAWYLYLSLSIATVHFMVILWIYSLLLKEVKVNASVFVVIQVYIAAVISWLIVLIFALLEKLRRTATTCRYRSSFNQVPRT